jgi:hypothetical protein
MVNKERKLVELGVVMHSKTVCGYLATGPVTEEECKGDERKVGEKLSREHTKNEETEEQWNERGEEIEQSRSEHGDKDRSSYRIESQLPISWGATLLAEHFRRPHSFPNKRAVHGVQQKLGV